MMNLRRQPSLIHQFRYLEGSLEQLPEQLRVDFVDMYFVHAWYYGRNVGGVCVIWTRVCRDRRL